MASYIDATAIVSFGIIITIYTQVFGFTEAQTGIGSAALTLGVAIGAIVGGRLGDRFGRRPVFSATMILVAIGALLVLLATSFPTFLVGAMLVGLGTGGDLPVSLSTISEAASDEQRGKLIGFSNVLWLVGILAAMVGGALVGNLGRTGAQILLAHFGVIAFILLILRLRIPESETWIEARRKALEGSDARPDTRGNASALLSSKYRAPFLALLVFYSLVNLGANTFGQFGTYLLVNAAGTSVSTASTLGLVSFPLMLVSAVWFLRVVDGPHRFIYFTVGAAISTCAMFVYVIGGFNVTTFILGNILFARQDKLVNRQESLGDDLAHALAHVADAQGKQHATERLTLGLVELGDDFLGRLEAYRNGVALLNALSAVGAGIGAPRVQACDVIDRELVEVCDVVNQPGGDHLVDDLVA